MVSAKVTAETIFITWHKSFSFFWYLVAKNIKTQPPAIPATRKAEPRVEVSCTERKSKGLTKSAKKVVKTKK